MTVLLYYHAILGVWRICTTDGQPIGGDFESEDAAREWAEQHGWVVEDERNRTKPN